MIFVLHNKHFNHKDSHVFSIQYTNLKDLIIIILQLRQHVLDYNTVDDIVIINDYQDIKQDIEYLINYVFNVLNIKLLNDINNINIHFNYKDKVINRTFDTKCSNTYYSLVNHLTNIDHFTVNNPKVTKILTNITFADLLTLRIPKNMISTKNIKEIEDKTYLVSESTFNNWTFNCNTFTRLQLLQISLNIIRQSCKNISHNQNLDIVVILCELNYHRDNAFHNFFHAVDVLQATSILIKSLDLNEVDKFTLLISTLFHDSCHNGNNNAMLQKNDAIHKLIGDTSILENIHFKILHHLFINLLNINLINNLNHRLRFNHLKLNNLDLTLSKDLILATDMQSHKNYLKILEGNLTHLNLLQIIIKAADISNVTRPLLISSQWAYRISKEFQSYELLEEGSKKTPMDEHVDVGALSVERCCQLQPNTPNTQIFFIENFASTFFGALNKKFSAEHAIFEELFTNLRNNYEYWKEVVKK
ncbi:uncharacterized protein HGUI_01126 [Hanseniaspora guilliermondii]|uniref:PDEase domain-containing protein n=1 Tax=Hanseniaspora guilliermondii TaxID=56406 RepID=A0A1L0FH63_9ASCO|nr:uncharacterized protein HGUI_01126 [Hanseniaspora guilliermondii]